MASPRPPLPPVTRAVRCSASIAATRLAWCVLVLCRGPHSSPLFENILERQYRIALAHSLRDRFLPILNGFLQALGEGCLVLDSDLCQRQDGLPSRLQARAPVKDGLTPFREMGGGRHQQDVLHGLGHAFARRGAP